MQHLALVERGIDILLHVAAALALRVRVLLAEQFVQDELLDRSVAAFLFQWDVKRVAFIRFFVLTHAKTVEIFIVQIAERLHDQLFAQMLMLVVLEVSVKHEANASLLYHVMAESYLHPLHILGKLLEHLRDLEHSLRLDQVRPSFRVDEVSVCVECVF